MPLLKITSVILAILIMAISCNENQPGAAAPNTADTLAQQKPEPKPFTRTKRKLSSAGINSNDTLLQHIFFIGLEGMVYLSFEKETCVFIFGLNRCEHTLPVTNTNNKISIGWSSTRVNCDYESGLDKNYHVKQPRKGDVFAEVSVYNDSTLKIDYLYPAFMQKLNARGRTNEVPIDTLFPTTFVIANR